MSPSSGPIGPWCHRATRGNRGGLLNLTEGAGVTCGVLPRDRSWSRRSNEDVVAPAVISRLAESLALVPGSTFRLRVIVSGVASTLPPATFEVAGVADFRFCRG